MNTILSRLTWMILGAIAITVLAPAIPIGIRAHRQYAAFKALDEAGIQFETRLWVPDWTIQFAGHFVEDPFARFSEINVIDDWFGKVDDAHLQLLRGISTLEELRIRDGRITPAGLNSLREMRSLKRLQLLNVPLLDSGIEQLKPLDSLEELDISQTGISDEGLKHLVGFHKLKRLSLSNTQVTETGLRHLANLPRLRAIQLDNTPVFRDACDALEHGNAEWLKAAMVRTPGLALAVDNVGDTLLHLAVQQEKFYPDVVRTLLAAGMDLEAESDLGRTVIASVARPDSELTRDKATRVQFLLDCGAEYSMRVAIFRDDLKRVRDLLHKPLQICEQRDCLRDAIDFGRATIVRTFISEWKLNPDDPDFDGVPFVCRATRHPVVLRELLDHGANPNARITPDPLGCFWSPEVVKDQTPLHVAARNGYSDSAELLVQRGAIVDARDTFSGTPLMEAVKHHRIAVLKLLIRHGADSSIRNVDGETALTLANKHGQTYPTLVELLEAQHEPE